MDDLTLARVLHVLGVVVWIGGVSMVTTVVLPAVRRGALGEDRLKAFEAFERRFIWQAQAAVLVVGPAREKVAFDAMLQPSTLQYTVSRGRG